MIQSIPDNSACLRRFVHAGFLQNDGAGTLWNGGTQDILTSPISFAQKFLSLLEVTIGFCLLSKSKTTQESYLEQPCKSQFHYGDDCMGIIIPEAIGTFLVCPVE